ncbi:uncharacterized protein LOC133735998 [Rosa rugosa]|uniref:uncharacterized protein LOC133735998 n=1 Tax=Rosa rugosa TaxID=74645 RepID=UPI002B411C9D|nr:uncharacterized protein LOC133735998 [Rosa rugosa]XP_062019418.1 uncharacterized protein LOC133735998 [Rosa rugosa]
MADPTQQPQPESTTPDTRKLRNICVLAHVDHGKTTLCDHLISGSDSGIIHPKLAGRLRYMDSLLEEQRRAITMKSSSIALRHRGHSVTVIDSPGHMDFCSEVSTAARLSDGALILVDAVEGVHIQTHAVLRQAWIEKLTPCLVINKIDRLIAELGMSPMDAYVKLLKIVHEVNNIVSAFKSVKYLNDVDAILSGPAGAEELAFEEIDDDEELMFQPQKGNVAFVCALDGWGFSIRQFAEFYEAKFGWSTNALQKALWGPWYFNHKEKKIVGQKGVAGLKKARPMFVEFVLEPVWSVYQAALKEKEEAQVMVQKVIRTFNLTIPPRDLKGDPKGMVQAVMSRWLPLHEAILNMVIRCMPDPIAAQSFRITRLLPKREVVGDGVDANVLAEAELVRSSVEACDSRPEAPCVVFVSKMFAVPTKTLPKYGLDGEILDNTSDEGELDECFLAFARIYSGVLRPGEKIYVLSALYDPLKGESMQKHIQVAKLHSLYLMMGQNLQHVPEAQAGDIVAIRGLGQHILKTATLSSTKNCWPFSSMSFQVSPTLKVAIEPSDPADMGALMKGLRLLNRADPFVEVTVSARGEHVLSAAGEVHLERCIKDLKDRFARVGLEVSKPLVSFKETILGDESTLENLKSFVASSEYVEKVTQNGRCVVRVKVLKLPPSLTKVIDESSDILADILGGKAAQTGETNKSLNTQVASTVEDANPIETLRKRMMEAVESDILSSGETDKDRAEKCKVQWQKLLKRIWALGPWHIGPNILLAPEMKGKGTDSSVLIRGSSHVSEKLGLVDASDNDNAAADTSSEVTEALYAEAERLHSSVLSGFQLATAAGPLCDEPMWGLAFVVEAYISPLAAQSDELETSHQQPEQYGIFTGQVMTAIKDACRVAVLQKKPRLVEAMYFCELITPTEQLGNMYAVLGRRRTKVLKEEMQEGSALFTVHAYVPVSESFGFADELRRWTAGAASALLVLSHWEALDKDPFFVPKTDEEKEEFGDGSSVPPNTARKLINAVRRQKGLPVEEKVVQHATKQRTLARKV